MSSNPQPRVWTHDDLEPGVNPDFNFPKVVDKYGVRWVADERDDGFQGWRSDSHGFRQWRTWFNLAFERGPLNEYLVTPQASSAERSIDPYIVEVLRYVSAGRRYVGVEPYPDSAARIALGRLEAEGLL